MSDERFDTNGPDGQPGGQPSGNPDGHPDGIPGGSPGGEDRRRLAKPVRILLWVVVIAAAVVVLFTWVFPWVESIQQDPTLGSIATVAGPAPVAAPLAAPTVTPTD